MELTAMADDGYRFEGWYEGDVLMSYALNYRFTALAEKTIKARFSKIPVKITRYPIELSDEYKDDAAVALFESGSDGAELILSLFGLERAEDMMLTLVKYDKDLVVTRQNVKAVYDGNFRFIVDGIAMDDWRRLEILDPSGQRIASLGESVYTITASAGENGAISPTGEVPVKKDADQSFTITPEEGYEVKDVLVDGQSVGAVTAYTFEKTSREHSISASFKRVGEETKRQQKLAGKTEYQKKYGDPDFELAIISEEGDGEITYESSDPSVVRVDASGIVTIEGVGTATITATAAETEDYKKTVLNIRITVSARKQKKDQRIIVYPRGFVFTEGGSAKALKVSNAKGGLTFKSSNAKVARVTGKGVVTPVSAGTATISVQAAGNEEYRAKTVYVRVNVYPKKPAQVKKIKVTAIKTKRAAKATWKKISASG